VIEDCDTVQQRFLAELNSVPRDVRTE